jgi:putative membrane protein
MTELVITRYLHFIAVFAIVGAIIAEQFFVSKSMTRKEIKQVSKIDMIYGIGALLVLIAGFLLWFTVGKPAQYYSRNWLFHTKLTMFIVLGLLSIYPSIFFFKNRKGTDLDTKIEVPMMIILLLRIELLIIIVMPILATYMSLGFGAF